MKLKTNKTKLSLALSTLLLMSLAATSYAGVSGGEPLFYDGKNTSLLTQDNSIYPMKDGQYITNNNLVIVDFDPNSPNITIPKYIFGGYTKGDSEVDVINTSIELINGSNTAEVVGAGVEFDTNLHGVPVTVDAIGSVIVRDGSWGDISGAMTRGININYDFSGSKITAIGSVLVEGGELRNTLTGATILSQSLTADTFAKGNLVINGGSVDSFVYGVYAHAKTTEAEGYVEINDGLFTFNVYGVLTANTDESRMKGHVKMTGGEIKARLHGVYSNNKTTSVSIADSQMDISGGLVEGDAWASVAYINEKGTNRDSYAQAKGTLNMSGGTVKGSLQSAWASGMKSADAIGKMTLTGGEFKGKQIFVSRARIDHFPGQTENYGTISTTHSYLKIGENATLSNPNLSIWGGFISGNVITKDAVTGNVFDFHGKPLQVDQLGNFAEYNLYVNDSNSNLINADTAMITVKKELHSEDTWAIDGATGQKIVTKNHPSILLKGISGEKMMRVGDQIHLLSADGAVVSMGDRNVASGSLVEIENLSEFFAPGETHELQMGLANVIEVEYEIDDETNMVTAKVVSEKEIDEELVEANVQPMVADRLAALMNITRKHGLQDPAMRDLVHGKVTPFVLMQGGRDRYQLDSHITADTFDALIGAGYKQNALSIAGYISYGYDDYKSYNNTTLGQVKGKGHNSSYGIGFSGIYEFNEALYADFGAQVGRIKTTYSSNDILTGGGTFANYNSKSTYFSGYVGGGYVYPFNETSRLDTSLRYMYSHIGSDTVTIDGDTIDFGGLTSSIAEIKTRYEVNVTDESTFNASFGYQYEFDAKGDARIAGIAVNAPGLKGSTGVVGIGYEYQPYSENEDSFLNRSKINIDAQGYFGKRRGGNIAITYRYMFD